MRAYAPRLRVLTRNVSSFVDQRRIFLADRFNSVHLLLPVMDDSADAFFTNGDDEKLQRQWAKEHGMKPNESLENILLAQIEAHGTDVFYNTDPVRYPSRFVTRLPGCVKTTIAWRAAPSGNADFGAYDLVVCNFPSILETYRQRGWRGAYFTPAHDPEMDAYAENRDRPIDVVFIGVYSRHHLNRARTLERVASLAEKHLVVYHLDRSRFTALAESPLGLIALRNYRRPENVRRVSGPPMFGRELLDTLSKAKIVLNGSIDMAGSDRGNMRCWEALGCGALLLSDDGNYPAGMVPGSTMASYTSAEEAVQTIERLLVAPEEAVRIARIGNMMIRERYSKRRNWEQFQALL